MNNCLQYNFHKHLFIPRFKSILFLLCCFIIAGCQKQHELEWVQKEEYSWAELPEFSSEEVGFTAGTDIDFVNQLTEDEIVDNRHLLNGSGVAAGDVNGDGLVDLYFAGLTGNNKLFKNNGGMNFEDITDAAGVAHENYYSTGVTFADVDGDGDLDLLVATNNSGVFLYSNDGNGRFELKSDSGLNTGGGKGGTTLTLSDIDDDGDLDLYVVNYKQKSVRDIFDPADLQWDRIVKKEGDDYFIQSPYDEHYTLIRRGNNVGRYEYGEKDELYINTGNGQFNRVTESDSLFVNTEGEPVELTKDWGLTAKFYDLNDDGLQDLYVNNDFWTPDRIWINRGNGTFSAIDKLAIRSVSASSMGVDFADIDNDGYTDFFTTDMLSTSHSNRMRQIATEEPVPPAIGEIDNRPLYMRNMLFHNRGDNTFEEIAQYSGVDASEWSWATYFMDIDLDGYEDIFITTGNAYDVQDADVAEKIASTSFNDWKEAQRTVLSYPDLKLRNRIFKNNGDLTFSDKSGSWGLKAKDVSHGAAIADLDNDGDHDIVVNRLNERAVLYRNDIKKPRIAVRLAGSKPNTQAVGARISLKNGSDEQRREISSGGGYLSGSDPLAVFAADAGQTYRMAVEWNDGKKSTYENILPNRIYKINEPEDDSPEPADIEKQGNSQQTAYFEEQNNSIRFKHHEESYEDFRLQPLLPYKLSRLGPGVAWIDYNDDGSEDLIVGSGKGGRTGVFQNPVGQNTRFGRKNLEAVTDTAPGDQTSVAGWKQSGNVHLLVGSANYEQGLSDAPSAYHYILRNGKVIDKKMIPGILSTTGPLVLADYDGDGDPDLFVGGSFMPAQYPVSACSRLFRNEDGTFVLDKENSELFQEVGLVKSGVFSDYDNDGDPDLFLATEWGPVKAFTNTEGSFSESTDDLGLGIYTGLWNGITTGDINNDGLPDLIATNRGMNSHYRVMGDKPLYIYYGDVDSDRRLEIFEAYFSEEQEQIVPLRNMQDVAPSDETLDRKITSHAEYGNASLSKIIGADLDRVPRKEVNTLSHLVFINTGETFRPQKLPVTAQFTAAFYAGVADYNNDGNEDIFLSQNLFALPSETSRSDAGRGLWLKGDGTGNFTAVRGQETGVKVYGEQKGAALGDYNQDGRVDLAVSQNGAELKLFQNIRAQQGLRIQLEGPELNSWAIGSSARIVFEDGTKGPLKEVQAGSGYWSQNSRTLLFGYSKKPAAVEINWFDGSRERIELEDLPDDLQLYFTYSQN